MEKAYRNIAYLFALVFLIVILGFYRTYFGLFPSFENVPFVVHFHSLAFILWSLLLIVQPLLIRSKKISIHKTLGKVSYVLAPIVVFTTLALARHMFFERQEQVSIERNLSSLYLPISHMVLFSLFYSLAIINKRLSPIHMRYIIAASLVVLAPAISRINFSWTGLQSSPLILSYVCTDLLLLGLIVFDWYKKRTFKPYIISLVLFMVIHFSTFFVPKTVLWQSFASSVVKNFF